MLKINGCIYIVHKYIDLRGTRTVENIDPLKDNLEEHRIEKCSCISLSKNIIKDSSLFKISVSIKLKLSC